MFSVTGQLPNDELTDNTRNHQCTQCGDCCSDNVALLESDIKRIKRYIQKHHIKEEDHKTAYLMIGAAKGPALDLTCPFLKIQKAGSAAGTQRAACSIYAVRPAVCRGFTCEIASNPDKMIEIYGKLKAMLTPNEMKELAATQPKSLRATFFPAKNTAK